MLLQIGALVELIFRSATAKLLDKCLGLEPNTDQSDGSGYEVKHLQQKTFSDPCWETCDVEPLDVHTSQRTTKSETKEFPTSTSFTSIQVSEKKSQASKRSFIASLHSDLSILASSCIA